MPVIGVPIPMSVARVGGRCGAGQSRAPFLHQLPTHRTYIAIRHQELKVSYELLIAIRSMLLRIDSEKFLALLSSVTIAILHQL